MSNPQPPRRVLRYIDEQWWAMLPSAYMAMREVVAARVAGERLAPDEIQANIEAAQRGVAAGAVSGSVALLPLQGIITPRADLMTEYSGGTSLESFQTSFRSAVADPAVDAIGIHAHTPGGNVYLVQETADLIYASRGIKPILGICNQMVASAGYWLLSQCDEIVITPSGEIGGLGVIMNHRNYAKANEMLGVESVYLTYGEFKAEGNPDEPLSEEAVQFLNGRLAEYGDAFVAAVARGRGLKAAVVKAEFGKGRVYGAKQAVGAGMADRIGTFQDGIDRLVKKKVKAGARAGGEVSEIQAEADEGATITVAAFNDGVMSVEDVRELESLDPREVARARARLRLVGRVA